MIIRFFPVRKEGEPEKDFIIRVFHAGWVNEAFDLYREWMRRKTFPELYEEEE